MAATVGLKHVNTLLSNDSVKRLLLDNYGGISIYKAAVAE
jgi:hypothetical protein